MIAWTMSDIQLTKVELHLVAFFTIRLWVCGLCFLEVSLCAVFGRFSLCVGARSVVGAARGATKSVRKKVQ